MPRLYKSLQAQICKNFEWLIVDDGSSDNTKKIVEEWVHSDNDFQIRYLYKENGGKHTALNYGVSKIDSELTFIVDSDDVLTSHAVEVILRYHERYMDENSICGYAYLRAYPDGKINGKEFVPNERVASYIDTRINSDDTMADKAEVYKTECLKEFPFPEYKGEKFLGEDIVWIRMARKYRMVHVNDAIYIGNYQDDGLTKNRRIHNIKSPIGCMNRAKEFLCLEVKVRYRIKAALQYIIYGRFADMSIPSLLKGTPHKSLVMLFLFPGLLIHHKWKREYKSVC